MGCRFLRIHSSRVLRSPGGTATSLTADVLNVASSRPPPQLHDAGQKQKLHPPPKTTPLQIRLLCQDVKAIKVAAVEAEQTISNFMLACFHAYMQTRKHS